jgi:hypothetical protein
MLFDTHTNTYRRKVILRALAPTHHTVLMSQNLCVLRGGFLVSLKSVHAAQGASQPSANTLAHPPKENELRCIKNSKHVGVVLNRQRRKRAPSRPIAAAAARPALHE